MLGDNQRKVILGRMAGRTLAQIGLELGLTRERIRLIQIEAMGIIKSMAEATFPKRKSA